MALVEMGRVTTTRPDDRGERLERAVKCRLRLLCYSVLLCVAYLAAAAPARAQNVFIVVIDGIRYSEGFGLEGRHLPRIWNDLRPKATIFTNFRNDGKTVTCPGHAAFLTGEYENLKNDGSERPHSPTLFEYYRFKTGEGDSCCYTVTGKPKLHVLTHSTSEIFGEKFGGRFVAPETMSDTATWALLRTVMDEEHPRLVIVNFPSVDVEGHDSSWGGYLRAMRGADSLVYLLWNTIQSDSVYKDRTTMFVSSDHGRHDDAHGGFQHHGCSCEGCRHIIGLGIGPGFLPGAVVTEQRAQTDVRAAAAELLSVPIPKHSSRKILDSPR